MHGQLLVDQDTALESIFAKGDRLIAVHAEDQARIKQRRQEFAGINDPGHSQIQDNLAALWLPTGWTCLRNTSVAYISCISGFTASR